MLDEEKYLQLLNNGLVLDHYKVLCNIRDNVKSVNSKRIQGFINLLSKKGYVDNGKITDKGIELLKCEPVAKPESKSEPVEYNVWCSALYDRIKNVILKKTGKSQVKAVIAGKSYNFIPNSMDFERCVARAISYYKLKDLSLIEKAIIGYINKCLEANSYFPLLQYYIIKMDVNKNGTSPMVTDIENGFDEPEPDKQFTILKNKDLF